MGCGAKDSLGCQGRCGVLGTGTAAAAAAAVASTPLLLLLLCFAALLHAQAAPEPKQLPLHVQIAAREVMTGMWANDTCLHLSNVESSILMC
jgi:hypothetical protein